MLERLSGKNKTPEGGNYFDPFWTCHTYVKKITNVMTKAKRVAQLELSMPMSWKARTDINPNISKAITRSKSKMKLKVFLMISIIGPPMYERL